MTGIAPDKTFFQPKLIGIFLISPWKHTLWVLLEAAWLSIPFGWKKCIVWILVTQQHLCTSWLESALLSLSHASKNEIICFAMRTCVFEIYRQRSPRSACAFAQSDLGLHCLLTKSLDTTECMHGEQRPRWYFAIAQDDLTLSMFKGTFCLDVAQIYKIWKP